MSTYYFDADSGNDTTGVGSLGAPWKTLAKAETGLSAGDVCVLRRGVPGTGMTGTYDDAGNFAPTNDGTLLAPITLEADYDNAWSDNIAASAQTYTFAFGSKAVTASADPSAELTVGDWIYNSTDGDDPRRYAYRVESISGTAITLHLPYKGAVGSGKTVTIMGPAPVWGDNTSALQAQWVGDTYWLVRGLHFDTGVAVPIRTTDRNGILRFEDCVFEANGASSIFATDYYQRLYISKGWSSAERGWFINADIGFVYAVDSYMYASVSSSHGHQSGLFRFDDVEFDTGSVTIRNWGSGAEAAGRNAVLSNGAAIDPQGADNMISVSDVNNTPGASKRWGIGNAGTTDPLITWQTSTVRSGGSIYALEIHPSAYLSTAWEATKALLLDLVYYATAAATTYTIYFRPKAQASSVGFSDGQDPTAAELYIEVKFYGHATNAYLRRVVSTGTLDFSQTSPAWQGLAVTFTPAQAGPVYIQVRYGKTKEASRDNYFYLDPLVVVS